MTQDEARGREKTRHEEICMKSCSMDSLSAFFHSKKRERERKSHPACFCPRKRSFPFQFFVSLLILNLTLDEEEGECRDEQKRVVMMASLSL
jgi:hypothetical protein